RSLTVTVTLTSSTPLRKRKPSCAPTWPDENHATPPATASAVVQRATRLDMWSEPSAGKSPAALHCGLSALFGRRGDTNVLWTRLAYLSRSCILHGRRSSIYRAVIGRARMPSIVRRLLQTTVLMATHDR